HPDRGLRIGEHECVRVKCHRAPDLVEEPHPQPGRVSAGRADPLDPLQHHLRVRIAIPQIVGMVRRGRPRDGGGMTTLHIEHAITDYATWKGAFDRFAEARLRAGVRGHRIRRPVDDPAYLYIDLDFATEEQAAAFLGFLRTQVWASPGSAPALFGAPQTRILTTVDE